MRNWIHKKDDLMQTINSIQNVFYMHDKLNAETATAEIKQSWILHIDRSC